MLNGIGGRTVEEAKERLSYAEFLDWVAYRKKFGPLNLGYRLEWILAQVAYVVAASNRSSGKGGSKLSIDKFLTFLEKPRPADSDEEVTLEGLARMFGAKT